MATSKRVRRVISRAVVTVKATFDSGPDPVDFTAPATLTLGTTQFNLTGLTSVKGGKKFTYDREGVKLTIKPSKIGSVLCPGLATA